LRYTNDITVSQLLTIDTQLYDDGNKETSDYNKNGKNGTRPMQGILKKRKLVHVISMYQVIVQSFRTMTFKVCKMCNEDVLDFFIYAYRKGCPTITCKISFSASAKN
jgi:hypothetical protein